MGDKKLSISIESKYQVKVKARKIARADILNSKTFLFKSDFNLAIWF